MKRVDLNCDVGESFGAYRLEPDPEIFRVITSANIACGFHAGGPATMRETVRLALDAGASVGAHPGLPDLIGFGRRRMDITPQEAFEMVVYQIGALDGFVKAARAKLRHVKPHGALYNMAARSSSLAEAIAEAVCAFDPALILYGPAGSELIRAGERRGLRTAGEVFADRTYQADGSLTSRREPNAVHESTAAAVEQALRLVNEGKVISQQGSEVSLQAETICVHGDHPHALEFARHIRAALEAAGIAVRALGEP